MTQRFQVSVVTLCIVAVATPATLALSLYAFTGNPQYRPLALQDDGLGIFTASPVGMQIHVDLHWTPRDGPPELALQLGRSIKQAFEGKGVEAMVVVQDDPTALSSYVTYKIGRNLLGPFPIRDAVGGISPAIDAIRAFERTFPELFEEGV